MYIHRLIWSNGQLASRIMSAGITFEFKMSSEDPSGLISLKRVHEQGPSSIVMVGDLKGRCQW